MTITYNKTLTPPEDAYVLETQTGLKFWRHRQKTKLAWRSSILTEDPDISMKNYGGGRERGSTYLFCYKGFKIGFFCQREDSSNYPTEEATVIYDRNNMTYALLITGIGTFVYEEEKRYLRDKSGDYKLTRTGLFEIDKKAVKSGKCFVTGLTDQEYTNGKRDKFENREQQDVMVEIWLELFGGFYKRKTKQAGTYSAVVDFSENMWAQLENGELIK